MNHPHEWLFNAHEKYEKTVFGFKCRHRDAVLEGPEVLKRLDATERLSAEDAKSAAELIASEFDYQWKWDGPDKYGPSEWKPRHDALEAYAAALEKS